MISAGSAVSESRTAPRTDCSASRFCGGAIGAPLKLVPWPLARLGALIGRTSLGWPSDEHLFVFRYDRINEEAPARPALRRSKRVTLELLLFDDHRLDGRDDAVFD